MCAFDEEKLNKIERKGHAHFVCKLQQNEQHLCVCTKLTNYTIFLSFFKKIPG